MNIAWLRRSLLLIAAGMLPASATADVLVVSQNALHLGQGSSSVPNYIPNKNAWVRALAAWPGNSLPQLTFLQEVMSQADAAAIRPAGGTVHFGPLKGTTSYLERYGAILVNDSGNHLGIVCQVDTASLITAGVVVQRPPDATLVRDATGGSPRLIWFLNFHATFGSGSSGLASRRAEIAEIGNIIARLRAAAPAGCTQTSDNAVVLGDWNLTATDAAFQTLAANAGFTRLGATPNVKTSLNSQGVPSNPYDHFIFDDARIQVTLAALPAQGACSTSLTFAAGVLSPASSADFRRNCSDHLGIAAVVKVR
ncbi:MAG TPA: hypothetical protein VGW40_07285 [Allosphingosinicella sp.]|nr:hypothetical protein [Allosphingosinicella sp.]